jgi:hypothetical protein
MARARWVDVGKTCSFLGRLGHMSGTVVLISRGSMRQHRRCGESPSSRSWISRLPKCKRTVWQGMADLVPRPAPAGPATSAVPGPCEA